jgi:hypothetical protein
LPQTCLHSTYPSILVLQALPEYLIYYASFKPLKCTQIQEARPQQAEVMFYILRLY